MPGININNSNGGNMNRVNAEIITNENKEINSELT